MSKKNILTYFTILENRKKKNGMYPVCLVVYFNGAKRRYRISVELTKEQWKKIKSVKLRDEELKEKRTEINSFIKKAETAGKKLPEFSFEGFEEEYFKKKQINTVDISFANCARGFMDEKKSEWSIKTSIMYETVLASIRNFQPNLKMKGVTSDFLRKYEDQLASENKAISTIGIYLRQIRAICNYAIGKKYMLPEKYPFKNFTVPAAQKNKRALSNEDIKTLIEYKTNKPEEQKAIDFWTFSYLGNGMNFKDIAILRYSNIQGDNIKFFRSKTKKTNKGEQKEISIYLLPRMREIINRWSNKKRTGKEYIFPILQEGMSEREALAATAQFIKITNKYLECVTEALEWKLKVTTYYARHSFATRLKRAGVPILYISESLGHANTTTTENYLSSFTDETVKSNAGLLLDL
ncbi:MAG: tyrosine-type recombinase/integrase [Bacteroidetes bacterium]|nr:tyrosine-type recombinase/integrase [Bacteroidota bacterium]